MKTTRIREKIKKFLGDRPRNTAEILEHINSTMRHGTTSQQLGNVLSKDKDIVKVGYIKRSGILSGGYDICECAGRYCFPVDGIRIHSVWDRRQEARHCTQNHLSC